MSVSTALAGNYCLVMPAVKLSTVTGTAFLAAVLHICLTAWSLQSNVHPSTSYLKHLSSSSHFQTLFLTSLCSDSIGS